MSENEETLLELLNNNSYSKFIHTIDEWNPMDAAEFFSQLPENKLPMAFRMLKKDTAAEIFAEFEPDVQEKLIRSMTEKEVGNIVEMLSVDDAVDMLEEMPAGIVKNILKNATDETRAEINRFLSYPEDSAGSVMTSELIDLRQDMTTTEAIERIRKIGLDKETVYVAYVTNESRVLEGVVPLKSLLYAKPDDTIRNLMNPNVIFAYTHDDREQVANLISHYDVLALPIVDAEKRLVGIVTVDDALDVLETEATEDMQKMAAVLPNEKPYLKIGIFETWKQRIPWLLLLMISATFTSTIISHYEQAIGTYAILTAFLPMLMDTGGNAGGQTSVTVIRGLSLGEIHLSDVFRVIWKEFRVALLCGATISLATFVKVMTIDFGFRFDPNNLLIALIVGITVCAAIVFAKIVGATLPLLAKKCKLDPAVMASPFITTIVDTVTLIIYFKIASWFLSF